MIDSLHWLTERQQILRGAMVVPCRDRELFDHQVMWWNIVAMGTMLPGILDTAPSEPVTYPSSFQCFAVTVGSCDGTGLPMRAWIISRTSTMDTKE